GARRDRVPRDRCWRGVAIGAARHAAARGDGLELHLLDAGAGTAARGAARARPSRGGHGAAAALPLAHAARATRPGPTATERARLPTRVPGLGAPSGPGPAARDTA